MIPLAFEKGHGLGHGAMALGGRTWQQDMAMVFGRDMAATWRAFRGRNMISPKLS